MPFLGIFAGNFPWIHRFGDKKAFFQEKIDKIPLVLPENLAEFVY
jgi:hypothetical protein